MREDEMPENAPALVSMNRPANDNQEKLPNNGWWIVTAFICASLLVLAFMGYKALAGEATTGQARIIDTIEIHGQTQGWHHCFLGLIESRS